MEVGTLIEDWILGLRSGPQHEGQGLRCMSEPWMSLSPGRVVWVQEEGLGWGGRSGSRTGSVGYGLMVSIMDDDLAP